LPLETSFCALQVVPRAWPAPGARAAAHGFDARPGEGPVPPSPPSGRREPTARPQRPGFDATHFRLDWAAQQATCPAGRTSLRWTPTVDHRRHDVIKIKFSYTDCGRCPHRARRIASTKQYQRRTLTVRLQAYAQAPQAARHRERTPEFLARGTDSPREHSYSAAAGWVSARGSTPRVAASRRKVANETGSPLSAR
jgi:hypothetical protein